jgi:hypothetical protein
MLGKESQMLSHALVFDRSWTSASSHLTESGDSLASSSKCCSCSKHPTKSTTTHEDGTKIKHLKYNRPILILDSIDTAILHRL